MGDTTLNPRQHEIDVVNVVVVDWSVITDPENISAFERFLFARRKRQSLRLQSASNKFIKAGLQNRRATILKLRDSIRLKIEADHIKMFGAARCRDAAQVP